MPRAWQPAYAIRTRTCKRKSSTAASRICITSCQWSSLTNMARVQIVTDSTADLSEDVARQLGIHVVPLTLKIGKESLRDGVDIDTARFLKKLKTAKNAPTTAAPPAKAFEDVYAQILREHDEILSIHISSKLSQTVAMAERGALPDLWRKRMAVVDSLLAS